jgi:hyperosmotically inducible protein
MNFAAAIVIAVFISPVSYADPDAAATIPLNQEFRKLDANRDGYISRDEAAGLRNFAPAFDEADENRDGRLDRDEFTKAQAIYDRSRAVAYLGDSVITAKIKAALVQDLNVKSFDVSVTTNKGVVILSGFVTSEKQAQRAQEIANSVAGVKSVKSALAVKS